MGSPRNGRVEILEREPGPSGVRVRASRFRPGRGVEEWHLAASCPEGSSSAEGIERLGAAYEAALRELGLAPETAVFRRIFVADLAASRAALDRSALAAAPGEPVAVSVVGQPPAPRGPCALSAYHLLGDEPLDRRPVPAGVLLRRLGAPQLWTAGLSAPGPAGAGEQTRAVLEAYLASLGSCGARLADHVVRTWLYLADIDRDYAEVVAVRREVFADHGLTERTHFVASTGIGGRRAAPRCLVSLDALALPGLRPGQVRFLSAPARLGRPSAYGPTFERGVRLEHGDRAHVVLSGTASIDPEGRVVHEGDFAGQADRALGNLEALLEDGGAGWSDVVEAVVYVRRAEDGAAGRAAVEARAPGVPLVVVEARVCRPAWLFEVECTAAVPVSDPRWPLL